ncbi:wax ester/triacylglycerol synthase family O-acyltransferase [uncultured Nocardioides sp.]|uniref:WS/DGAT/MGAT family O-acyltransferase n=1 Tax=uncultured Nocardioides sp. TaxID=198441 RepID=UPI0026108CAC|nr:wax ester/triacylglycerol synthase family O-acyltransferase [uncultured Nocardioides sp.]
MDRLRPRDLSLLATEAQTPVHNATVEIFEGAGSGTGLTHERLTTLVAERIAFVPRYRQRLQEVPGGLAAPAWVDDTRFDLAYHVRRSALPRPGGEDQLRELVARIVSRPLDRSRPLWELYLVEGLEGDRVALLSKSHPVLADGVHTVDLAQVLIDADAEDRSLGDPDPWTPRSRPGTAATTLSAVRDTVRRPYTGVETLTGAGAGALRGLAGGARRVAGITGALGGRTPTSTSPVTRPLSQQRRLVLARTDLAVLREVREAHGGSVNDVVLAVVAGGLRGWLMTRSESMGGIRKLRALVPLSVFDDELEATSLGSQIAGHLVDLPVGEPNPVLRLHQVSYSFKAHREGGRAVAARRLVSTAGFAPSTYHALGSRLVAAERSSHFDLSVTNVPGPQQPRYAAGARLLATYPVPPLMPDHALAIGVTSYDGGVHFGVTTDRDALPDADVLGQCLLEAVDELVDSARNAGSRAPRGR